MGCNAHIPLHYAECKKPKNDYKHLVKMGALTKKQAKLCEQAENIGFDVYIETTHVIPESMRFKPHFETKLKIEKTLYNDERVQKG